MRTFSSVEKLNGSMLTAYLDRLLGAVRADLALRRARVRRQRALKAAYDDDQVRWVDGEPWVRAADGLGWKRLPGSRLLPQPLAIGPGWRASTFWERSSVAPQADRRPPAGAASPESAARLARADARIALVPAARTRRSLLEIAASLMIGRESILPIVTSVLSPRFIE